MPQLRPVVCRRCSRPLRAHLSARAGIGARCALFEAAESPQEPAEAVSDTDAPAAAAAAVTAVLHGLPDDVVDDLVAGAGTDTTRILVGLLAHAIRETTGGPAWLERLALDWAAAEVD